MKKDFAEWMRSQLGYQVCALDFPINDAEASRTRFASVRGETYGVGWYRLRWTAVVLLAASLISRVLIPVREGGTPVVATSLAYLSLVAYLISLVGRWRTRQYSWVECRDLERPLTGEEIMALKDTVESVRRGVAPAWRPAKVLMVVGANGFDDAAVGVAQGFSIECYQRAKRGFRRVA